MKPFEPGAIVRPTVEWDGIPCSRCAGTGVAGTARNARALCLNCGGKGRLRANLRGWGKLLHAGDDPRTREVVEIYTETGRKYWRVEWSDGVRSWVEEKNLEVIAGAEEPCPTSTQG